MELSEVPEWLESKLARWKQRLKMEEWTIHLRLERIIDNDPTVKGKAEQWPTVNCGIILINADAEDTPEWDLTLVHELLHIKHSRIDAFVEESLFPQISAADEMLSGLYRQVYEPFIERLARAIVELNHGD